MGRAERSWGFQFQTVCALTSPSPQKVKHFTQSVSPNSLTEIWLGRQCSSPKENEPPLRQAARLRPRHAGVVSIHLRLFTCPPSTYRTRARRWREGGGEGSTRGHGPALVGPVRSYLASLSVFPLPGFSRLPKSCRHVCSRLKKLCRQRPSTLDFGSGHNLRVLRLSPPSGSRSAESACPSLPLCSLSKINTIF